MTSLARKAQNDGKTTTSKSGATSDRSPEKPSIGSFNTYKHALLYLTIYSIGVGLLFLIIAEPFTIKTYFSDNSLLAGLANREFSLGIEAEYYLKDLNKLAGNSNDNIKTSLTSSPAIVNFINRELDNFGLEVFEQNFNYLDDDVQFNGTNLYSIIRAQRSTSSEAMILCVPYKITSKQNTLPGVALTLSLAKYFSYKSIWAKDLILLFIDHEHMGLSAWLDSYYDGSFRENMKHNSTYQNSQDSRLHYESLPARSGPLQSAIVLELYGKQFTRLNVKVHGMYGQLPNLDLFNVVIDLAYRESITPYFHDKSLPFDLSPQEFYQHHMETALSFMLTQATMKSDGLHGHFLKHAVQSLTLECPAFIPPPGKNSQYLSASLLNLGRMVEGIFISLNNLTERFNRSYYFYIILSLRRFTSIGYYMIPFGFISGPLILKVWNLYRASLARNEYLCKRGIAILLITLPLSLISTFNISLAILLALPIVPIMIIFL